jgi:hypothetical protein
VYNDKNKSSLINKIIKFEAFVPNT